MYKEKKQHTILIISYYFPPCNTIAALRVGKLAQYLNNNWNVVVVCASDDMDYEAHNEFGHIYYIKDTSRFAKMRSYMVETFNSAKNKTSNRILLNIKNMLVNAVRQIILEILAYPDRMGCWRKHILNQISSIIAKQRPDIMLASGGPWSDFIIADSASRQFNIPWVADYRDQWTNNTMNRHTPIRRYFEKNLEIRVLKSASSVVVVADPTCVQQQQFLNKPCYTITNGFDPDDYDYEITPYKIFTIVYTGMIYFHRQDVSLLFQAINNLLQSSRIEKNKICVKFWGTSVGELKVIVDKYNLNSIVEINKRIPLKQSIDEQKKASVLLYLNNTDLTEKGSYSGKIFEYLAAQRPILGIHVNPGAVSDLLLEQTNAGVMCADLNAVEQQIMKWYTEFYQQGHITYNVNNDVISQYTRENMAQKFDELLLKII